MPFLNPRQFSCHWAKKTKMSLLCAPHKEQAQKLSLLPTVSWKGQWLMQWGPQVYPAVSVEMAGA